VNGVGYAWTDVGGTIDVSSEYFLDCGGTTVQVNIRPFSSGDAEAVRQVHLKAFAGREDEARLVEALHAADAAPVSLVAVDGSSGGVMGHVLFSPVKIDNSGSNIRVVGLAPVGVLPEYQGQGVGSRLISAGLEACREAAYDAVVLLGEPGYYSRFSFERASAHDLGNEYGVDHEFMVVELSSGALDGLGGTVRYRPEFGQLDA
jgi:putative acetyltransferase